MAQNTSLLGPPEVYNSTANNRPAATAPPMGRTENNSATYLSSGNPCLDFFFHVVPNTPAETLKEYLQNAWDHHPLTALKLICNLRGVRGTGKSDKEGYYTAALWLHKHHPKTLACNVAAMANFGYFKDLPELLYRLLEGADVRQKAKQDHERKRSEKLWKGRRGGNGNGYRNRNRLRIRSEISGKRVSNRNRNRNRNHLGIRSDRSGKSGRAPFKRTGMSKSKSAKMARKADRAARVLANVQKHEAEKIMASVLRHEKKAEKAKKAVGRYSRDPDFKFLFERVSDFFAESLKKDMESFKSGKLCNISLAAKWCPSLDSSFDRATLICESIARKVFPREMYAEYEGVEDAHYAYRVRDRLRKEVLVPLRKALELPEVYMGANDWGSLPYGRVPSVAMKLYKEKFLEHDKERFGKYLEDVKTGKAKIAAGALLPHDIIKSLNDECDGGQVAELQWQRMVDDLAQKGKLKNCIAVCDVSGSMKGEPMEVCVALGILVSELSEKPWKGKVITFSEHPRLERVEGETLREKIDFVEEMEFDGNTDFQKVFDRILEVAVDGDLKKEDMIKRVFVFSDMEFDEACRNDWETDYQTIVRKYGERGYGDCVPEIVFWNLQDSRSTPVPSTQKGVALVSGFSKNLLRLFLENDGELNPELVMEAAIGKEEYQKLLVVD